MLFIIRLLLWLVAVNCPEPLASFLFKFQELGENDKAGHRNAYKCKGGKANDEGDIRGNHILVSWGQPPS